MPLQLNASPRDKSLEIDGTSQRAELPGVEETEPSPSSFPEEGLLEGTSCPPSLIYDQLGVCLILPWAQIGEQATLQIMPEGRDGQRGRLGQNHDQCGGNQA